MMFDDWDCDLTGTVLRRNTRYLAIFPLPLALLLTACSGADRNSTAPPVTPPTPVTTTVSITPGNTQLVVGSTATFVASALTGTGTVLSGRTVTWNSASPAIASVNAGVVTGVAPGAADIMASIDGKSASVTVTVVAPVPVAVAPASAATGLFADVNDPVTPNPTVRVVDARNSPVAGVTVTFAIIAGGGSVTGVSKQTGANGTASPDSWTLGATAGANALSATVTGLSGSPVTFTATALSDTGVLAPRPVTKTTTQKLYMHYMPWFETPQSSPTRKWGLHWTMATANPDIIRSDGTRQIASFYYPLIGPYASSDRDVIDYHLLLMKYAGLDGVLVDWYGVHEVYDYPQNRRNTDSLFARVAPAGLQFAVVYEDQTLPHVKTIAGSDTIIAAQQDFAYLQSQYFGSNSYLRIDGQPLLMVFGPQTMKKASDWTRAFMGLATPPLLVTLFYSGLGQGEFAWPDQAFTTGLSSWYQNRAPGLAYSFGSAYPGFNDYYTPGGVNDCCSWTIPVGRTTLQQTLDLSRTSNSPRVQIATWNDFGEGTMIEPTNEFGFTFLETIQKFAGVPYTSAELNLVYRWYTLKKRHAADAVSIKKLNQAYYYLVSLRVTKAKAILDTFAAG